LRWQYGSFVQAFLFKVAQQPNKRDKREKKITGWHRNAKILKKKTPESLEYGDDTAEIRTVRFIEQGKGSKQQTKPRQGGSPKAQNMKK